MYVGDIHDDNFDQLKATFILKMQAESMDFKMAYTVIKDRYYFDNLDVDLLRKGDRFIFKHLGKF